MMDAESRIEMHEAVCAERYKAIEARLQDGSKRMNRIEYLLYAVIVAVLFGPGVAADFIKHFFHM